MSNNKIFNLYFNFLRKMKLDYNQMNMSEELLFYSCERIN